MGVLARASGLAPCADVPELREPLRLGVHLARRRRPVETPAAPYHLDEVVGARPAAPDPPAPSGPLTPEHQQELATAAAAHGIDLVGPPLS